MKKIVDRWSRLYAHRIEYLKSSATRDLMGAASRPDMISFAGGLPSPEAFDTELVKQILFQLMENAGKEALQYGPTEGRYNLREKICNLMNRIGLKAHPDNIIITSGAQQALDILGKLFLEPGAEAVLETPSYAGALNAFQVYEPHLLTVFLKEDGMDIEQLKKILSRKSIAPRFVYTIPNFHNPAGVTLSLEKRKELIEQTSENDMLIIEDNAYGDLSFEGEQLPTLKSMNEEVVYLGTLSKILSPGIRIGWVFASVALIQKINAAKQGADLCTSTLNQMLAERFLDAIDLDTHIKKIREIYRIRRDVMIKALEEFFPEESSWTKPLGGFYLWVVINADINTTDMMPEALNKKVIYVPGEGFYLNNEGKNAMRLSFCNPAPEQIYEGIERLAEVVKEQIHLSRTIIGINKKPKDRKGRF